LRTAQAGSALLNLINVLVGLSNKTGDIIGKDEYDTNVTYLRLRLIYVYLFVKYITFKKYLGVQGQ
jgi:hypothetical protein